MKSKVAKCITRHTIALSAFFITQTALSQNQSYTQYDVHGIRYRKDDKGKIIIGFEKSDGELICIIEDNGIGRSEAHRLKSASPIEYQSKGMPLIASRIEYLNRDSESTITLRVEDLTDGNHPLGTRVIMKFPLINTHNY